MKDETEAMQAVIKRDKIKYEDEDEEYLFGVPDEEKPIAKDEPMEPEVMLTADESHADNDFFLMSIETQLDQIKLGGSEESGERDLKNNKGLMRDGGIQITENIFMELRSATERMLGHLQLLQESYYTQNQVDVLFKAFEPDRKALEILNEA